MANSPSLFVSIMNDVFKGMEEFVLVYLDDILIFSKNQADHENHLRAVLQRLREHQFYVKLSKCEFFKDTLLFLGHILSKNGVSVNPEKIKALLDWPAPTNVTEIRQFVGLANVFRKFVLGLSSMARPLTELTVKRMSLGCGDQHSNWRSRVFAKPCALPRHLPCLTLVKILQ